MICEMRQVEHSPPVRSSALCKQLGWTESRKKWSTICVPDTVPGLCSQLAQIQSVQLVLLCSGFDVPNRWCICFDISHPKSCFWKNWNTMQLRISLFCTQINRVRFRGSPCSFQTHFCSIFEFFLNTENTVVLWSSGFIQLHLLQPFLKPQGVSACQLLVQGAINAPRHQLYTAGGS